MRKLKIEFPSAKQTNVPKIVYSCTSTMYMIFLSLENNPFNVFGAVHSRSKGVQNSVPSLDLF